MTVAFPRSSFTTLEGGLYSRSRPTERNERKNAPKLWSERHANVAVIGQKTHEREAVLGFMQHGRSPLHLDCEDSYAGRKARQN